MNRHLSRADRWLVILLAAAAIAAVIVALNVATGAYCQ